MPFISCFNKHFFVLTFVFTFSFITTGGLYAQRSDADAVRNEVTQASVEAHVGFLASDLLRGRDTPSEGLQIAADYIASHFKRHGVLPAFPALQGSGAEVQPWEGYKQPVDLVNVIPADEGEMRIGKREYAAPEQFLQTSGGDVSLSGNAVFLGYGTPEDFKKAKVKGKIVVTRGGVEGSADVRQMFIEGRRKKAMAREAGAAGLIELYNSPQTRWTVIQFYLNTPRMAVDEGAEDGGDFPVFWLEDTGNEQLKYLSDYKGKIDISVRGAVRETLQSENVIGFVPGTDPDLKNEYIVYSAHYDHVGIGVPDAEGDSIYNGTRDNAIGTATVLEAAASIAKRPLKRSALFVLFTGEEKGLLGSEWFVKHSPVPLKKIVFNFNSDNAGYNNTDIAMVIGLERTSAGPVISEACAEFGLEAIRDPMPRQNLFDRSDQVNFAKAGIPALMYSLGATAFDDEIIKYYHRPADNPDSVDYEYLHRFTKAYVLAGRRLGNAPERPYWTEGDKYFSAGEELYGP